VFTDNNAADEKVMEQEPMTRTELDTLLDQQQPRDEQAFSAALGAATTLCWDEIPASVRADIVRRTALLLELSPVAEQPPSGGG
jgi:hypothetical protein